MRYLYSKAPRLLLPPEQGNAPSKRRIGSPPVDSRAGDHPGARDERPLSITNATSRKAGIKLRAASEALRSQATAMGRSLSLVSKKCASAMSLISLVDTRITPVPRRDETAIARIPYVNQRRLVGLRVVVPAALVLRRPKPRHNKHAETGAQRRPNSQAKQEFHRFPIFACVQSRARACGGRHSLQHEITHARLRALWIRQHKIDASRDRFTGRGPAGIEARDLILVHLDIARK